MYTRLMVALACIMVSTGCGDKKGSGPAKPGFWEPYAASYLQSGRSKMCDSLTWTTNPNANGVLCEGGPEFSVELPGFTLDTMIVFEGRDASGNDSVDVTIRGKIRQGLMCQGELEYHTWMKPTATTWVQYAQAALTFANPVCKSYEFCFEYQVTWTRTGDAPDPCESGAAKLSAFPLTPGQLNLL